MIVTLTFLFLLGLLAIYVLKSYALQITIVFGFAIVGLLFGLVEVTGISMPLW